MAGNIFDTIPTGAPASGGNVFDSIPTNAPLPNAADSLVPPIPSRLTADNGDDTIFSGGGDQFQARQLKRYAKPSDALTSEFSGKSFPKTPAGQSQLSRLTGNVDAATLPVQGTTGQVATAISSPPKTFTDLIDVGNQIQQNNRDTDLHLRSLAQKHGIDPDSVAKLPNLFMQYLQGGSNAALETGVSLTSPLAMLTGGFGALPKAAQKAASLGFSAQMLSQFPDQAKALLDEENKTGDDRDESKVAQNYLGALTSLGFGLAAGAHGTAPDFQRETAAHSNVSFEKPTAINPLKNAIQPPQPPAEAAAVAQPPKTEATDQNVSQPAGQGTVANPQAEATAENKPVLQPALKLGDKIYTGGGNKHVQIAVSHSEENPDLLADYADNHEKMSGFVDQNGKFYTRAEAAKTGVFGDKAPQSENLPNFDENGTPPPKKVTPVESAKPVSDFERYQQLTSSLKGKTMDEAQPILKEVETIKNRNGGNPPPAPESPTAAAGVVNPKNAPEPGLAAPVQSLQKYRFGNSPQLHSLVETLPATETEIANGEQPVRIRNDKTGKEEVATMADLTAVTEKSAADKTSQANKSKALNDQLKAAGLDPSSFPNVASKRLALKRQKALAIGAGPGAATATGGEFSMPTIEDQLSGGQLAPAREASPAPPIESQNKSTINSMSDVVKNSVDSAKGWLGGLAGKTFPKTTLISKHLGELGARWISSKIASRPKAELFVAEVLGDSGLKSRDVGAALTEDNLRSIKKAYLDKGDTEGAAKVQSIIGKVGSPFKTEKDYQKFLNDPKFKDVVERHKDMWKSTVEPQYRAAMRIDPDTELPSRGLQTGARINLRAVREGENPRNVVNTTAKGNLLNTLRKKSPFGIQATGAGEAYHTDLHDLMENTFGRQDEIANKNEFEKALVESGNAMEGKPGQQVNIGGRPAVGFPLTRKTIITDGKPVAQNRTLYLNPKIASEYRIGANVDWTPPKGVFSKISSFINQSAIASATEATTHVMNLGSALFALPATSGKILNDAFLTSFGRADIPVKVVQTIMKSMKDNRAQIAGLSQIGAMRDYHEPTRIPLMRQASQMIQWMDKNTRLVLDDAYQRMRDQGLVDPSETARREFVNQVGQYNQRAQPYLMGQMRKLGISPFVTAGKNFNTLGIREATLNPGVKATSATAALALRANMLSKWVGTAALLGTVNYLLTKDKGGGVSGRPGTPLGYIDTGHKDKNGRNVLINLLGITGQGRALRVTGAKGFIDAERMGLGAHNGMDTAARDMINSAVSPWAGPLPRFAVGAASGYPTAVNVGRAFPVVPPGTSQHVSDFKNAVIQMNPVVAGINQAMKPNSSGWIDAVRSQFPRLVPQAGRSDSMTKNYPEIVQKAQANEFTDYVVHAARTVPIATRQQFVESQISRLPAELQPKARQEMIYRKVYVDDSQSTQPASRFKQ